MVNQRGQPAVIVDIGQIMPDHSANQPPELIARIGIVSPGGKACLTWQAAKDKDAGAGINNRRERRLALDQRCTSGLTTTAGSAHTT